MKKIISLILAMAMLLSVCAMAEGFEMTVGNITCADSEGNKLSLSGIDFKLAAARTEEEAGLGFSVYTKGEKAAEAVLSTDENGLYLSAEGISDIYALPFEKLEKLINSYMKQIYAKSDSDNIFKKIVALVDRSNTVLESKMKAAGSTEIDGVSYKVYDLKLDSDQVMKAFGMLDQLLETCPIIVEGAEYESFAEMFKSEGVKPTVDGQVYYGKDVYMCDLSFYANGHAIVNVFTTQITSIDEETGLTDLEIYVSAYDPEIPEKEKGYMGSLLANVYTDTESGAFMMAEAFVDCGQDDDDGVLVSLDIGSDEKYGRFSITSENEELECSIVWDKNIDDVVVILEIRDIREEEKYLTATLEMADDTKGSVSVYAKDEKDSYTARGDVVISEIDVEWLPETDDAVDVLSIKKTDVIKLGVEALGVLHELISTCSDANEDFEIIIDKLF